MAVKAWKQKLNTNPTGFEQWGGYMEAKKQKLNEQFDIQATSDEYSSYVKSKIFAGVSIFVNGFTVPSAEELKMIMLEHGGKYHAYYSESKTTHIIATNLPHFKIKKLKDEKVVRPEWIVDSISKGILLPCSDYQLYTGTANYNSGQKKLEFESKNSICLVDKLNSVSGQICDDSSVNFETFSIDFNKEKELPINKSELHTSSKESITESTTNNVDLEMAIAGGSLKTNSSKIVKAGQPNFLSEYYSRSRLHHISTAAADFKEYVKMIHNNHNGVFSGRGTFIEWKTQNNSLEYSDERFILTEKQKAIMHLDMDCFFVSVALRNHPELVGKPVAVTHAKSNNVHLRKGTNVQFEYNFYKNKRNKNSKTKENVQDNLNTENFEDGTDDENLDDLPNVGSRSEVASCSYEARQCGVKNGMYIGEAFRLCPNLQLVPYDFEGYNEVSQELYNLVTSLTLEIEAISCDEMFIDCSEVLKATNGSPLELAAFLREEIKNRTRCTASAGIGSCILIARLATRNAKPNGQFMVAPEEEISFMKKQLVKDLPGVGYATSSRLAALNVVTCEDLQAVTLYTLQKEFGPKTGITLFNHCRGKDDRVVKSEKERKSVSAEINYGMRFEKSEEPEIFLKELAEEVSKRLHKINAKGKLITLKVKVRSKDAPLETAKFMGHGVCDNVAKSITVHLPTDNAELIGREAINCLKQMKLPHQDIRGMGIQVSRLMTINAMEKQQNKTLFHFIKNTTSIENSTKALPFDGPRNKQDHLSVKQSTSQLDNFENSTLDKKSVNDVIDNVTVTSDAISPIQENFANQIDESFLNALPEDIRKEVLDTYHPKKKEVKTNSLFKTKHAVQTKKKVSPKKSPQKFKPLKLMSKKISPSKSSTITNNFTVTNKTESTSVKSNELEKNKMHKPSLCGETDLGAQRKLIAEWVKFSEPLDDDINTFLGFMLTLIDNHDLEHLDLILKCLHRNIKKEEKDSWKIVYTAIINEVQKDMKLNYGHKLKVEMF